MDTVLPLIVVTEIQRFPPLPYLNHIVSVFYLHGRTKKNFKVPSENIYDAEAILYSTNDISL